MRSSRKQQAAELRRTWTVYEPRSRGVPMTRRDVEDANERERAQRADAIISPTEAVQVPMQE